MITIFENFTGLILENFNLGNYIKKNNGVFQIPNIDFNNPLNKRSLDNPKYYVDIQYNNLMRFFLYEKLLLYNGNDPIILNYISNINNPNLKSRSGEIINKIPNNNIIFSIINKMFGFGFPDYKYNNVVDLKKIINVRDKVLSDKNLVRFIKIVERVTFGADISELISKNTLSKLYGNFDIKSVSDFEDTKGVDLWKVDKKTKIKQSIQVKNIPNLTINGNKLVINNTRIDLHPYSPLLNTPPFDYLVLYQHPGVMINAANFEKLYIIKITDIENIKIIKNSIWSIEIRLTDTFSYSEKIDGFEVNYTQSIEDELEEDKYNL